VDARGFATIRSKGDTALFGWNSTKDMKEKLGVPDSSPLADYLPTLTIAAKNLATEITNHNVESNNLQGERKISDEHVTNNTSVRGLLVEKGIFPEALPAEEDLKKLKRKIEKEHKLLNKNPKRFNQKD
jgi:DNA-damage-inducible protein D